MNRECQECHKMVSRRQAFICAPLNAAGEALDVLTTLCYICAHRRACALYQEGRGAPPLTFAEAVIAAHGYASDAKDAALVETLEWILSNTPAPYQA